MAQSLEDLMKARGLVPHEINFAEPWEARAFAIALALSESGRFAWEEFRQRLIAEIAQADAAAAAGAPRLDYYECWLRALEAVLGAKGIAAGAEIDRHADRIAANPPAPTKAVSTGPVKIA
jgi:nitrile hydratase accessory protein